MKWPLVASWDISPFQENADNVLCELSLPYPILDYPALSCPILHCPTPPYPALPHSTLLCPTILCPDHCCPQCAVNNNNNSHYITGIKYIGELTPRTKDALVSYGERMSVRIVAATLNKIGVPAQVTHSVSLFPSLFMLIVSVLNSIVSVLGITFYYEFFSFVSKRRQPWRE